MANRRAKNVSPEYRDEVLRMYTACTYQLAQALDLSFLVTIPRYFFYVAFIAWTATFLGFVRSLALGFGVIRARDAAH